MQAQHVVLAGRAGEHDGRANALSLVGVITQKVNRFAHFGDRIAPSFERFFNQQCAEARQFRLHRVGGLAQHLCAVGDRHVAPCRERCVRRAHRVGGLLRGRISGARYLCRFVGSEQQRTHRFHREINASAVDAWRQNVVRQRQIRRLGNNQRRCQQLADINRVVRELMHERRIRTVLKQPAHEIREQIAVRADRCVDAHGLCGFLAVAGTVTNAKDLAIHTGAHAV